MTTRSQHGPVLMAVHSAKPAGAQLVALGQAETLAATHELVIAVGEGELRSRFAALGEIIRPSSRLPIWGASPQRWSLEIARAAPDALRLAREIRSRGVSAVIVNSSILIAPVLAARLAGVPVIVHIQEAPKSAAVRRLLKFHGRFANTVVAISPGIAEALGKTRAHILLNPVGIPLPDYAPPAPRPADSPLRLVVVGTVDRHKRQDLAISALTELVASGTDAHLELIGGEADPTYSTELRTLATSSGVTDRITFSGQRDDVAQRVSSADMLLLPAGEVTPLVLMEAMALGTPVVAARMGSIADVVANTGLLIPPDDPTSMATAITSLATNPTLATTLATSARTRIETHYDQRLSHTHLLTELTRLTT